MIRYRDAVQLELDRLARARASSPQQAGGSGPAAGPFQRLRLQRPALPPAVSEPVPDASDAEQEASVTMLRQRLRGFCADVEAACAGVGGTPADLPAPSRRAYQWLEGLTAEGALAEHIALRRRVQCIFSSPAFRATLPRHRRRLALLLRVEHASLAFRATVDRHRLELRLSEAFRGAPDPVLRALLEAALVPGSDASRAQVVAYCRRSAFRDRIAGLERIGRGSPDEDLPALHGKRVSSATGSWRSARGQHHDLQASFERVSMLYLDQPIEPPHLRWSARATHRKMGHYEWEGDVVQINRRLDDPAVPAFVIDFVMYHELLHKVLGFETVGGRRRVHTPEFRRREREFERYREAQDFLDDLEARLSAGP